MPQAREATNGVVHIIDNVLVPAARTVKKTSLRGFKTMMK